MTERKIDGRTYIEGYPGDFHDITTFNESRSAEFLRHNPPNLINTIKRRYNDGGSGHNGSR